MASKRRGKDAAIDQKLPGLAAIFGNLLPDDRGVARAEPVEVERDEDLHPVVGRRLVREIELLVRVRVDANVEREGVDAGVASALHIVIVVVRAGAVRDDADLVTVRRTVSLCRSALLEYFKWAATQDVLTMK